MTLIQNTLLKGRQRVPQSFDVEYFQGGNQKTRLVYATDEHGAALVVIRSTWAVIRITKVTPIIARVKRDWSPA